MSRQLDGYAFLEKLIRISNSNVNVERRLQNMLQLFTRELGLKKAFIFNLDRETGDFTLRTADDSVNPPTVILKAEKTLIGNVAEQRKAVQAYAEDIKRLPEDLQPFVKSLTSILVFPILDDQVLFGVLVLAPEDDSPMDQARLRLIETAAREIAGTIRISRLYNESKKRIAELSVLYEVGRAVSSTIDLNVVLRTIVNITCKVLQASGCALNVLDLNKGGLRVSTEYGEIPDCCRYRSRVVEKGDSHVKTPEIFNCIDREEPFIGSAGDSNACPCLSESGEKGSIICLPLGFKGRYKGTLSVYDKIPSQPWKPREFRNEDLELLTTMGALISSSVENALSFQDVNDLAESNERLVENLRRLYEISGALMTTVKLDELLSIITKSLTLDQGLGFERALVFLINEEGDEMHGAAIRKTEPHERIGENSRPLGELLHNAAADLTNGTELEKKFSKIKIPIGPSRGSLLETIIQKKPMRISGGENYELVNHELPLTFGDKSYVTAPMLVKGNVVGVIAVDRAISGGETTGEDVHNLTLLANQAGLAIENSRLYEYIEHANITLSQTRERLIEAEKLAALGEMAAGMAHEIRNPLVSIGGFTRRLLKSMEDDSPQRVYVQVIINEVTRLEKTLSEVLDFSSNTMGHLDEHNLNDVVADALYVLRRDFKENEIEISTSLSDIPSVLIDERQIKHVLFNLFFNALQAMGKKGTISIRTYSTQIDDRAFVACDISDSGTGIAEEVLPNIFNPFFTTKDTGTGLGLSIVHKIVTRHYGEIDVVNRLGQGATFIIKLPVAAEAGLYLK